MIMDEKLERVAKAIWKADRVDPNTGKTWEASIFSGGNQDSDYHAYARAAIQVEAPEKDEHLATVIPMDDCGLSINVGTDGTWMHFKASNRQQCSFNMENMAERDGGITKSALLGWCADRREQATTISER